MKKLLLMVIVVFMFSGCVHAPSKTGSFTWGEIGPETGYSNKGPAGVHEWSDDDARLALWLRRNFPERWAEIPFPILTFFDYNIHNDRQQLMPFEWEYYFANMRDPYLQVRMYTLEARYRNDAREAAAVSRELSERSAAEKPVIEDVSQLSNQEVSNRLQSVFP